ncbi:hypothetical protein MFUM_360002 [Methylacidiphilum fumariolicum SolV]|uniref:Uncharacterized protein n=2 Tax=Candidatus Methylacidiphilum fumarolicum TaxID=591154 RepID=I0JY15_METFB|nr:conserved protein of unknown function [Candidatus Methylacidiphilum fumarolicum]CCG92134.1 hypothetical protein MFUM_360002 [Methylacidiphilum fumariolicum SolV]
MNNRFQLFNAFRLIDTPFSTPPEKVEKDACYYVLSSKSQFFVGIYNLKQVFLRGQPTLSPRLAQFPSSNRRIDYRYAPLV